VDPPSTDDLPHWGAPLTTCVWYAYPKGNENFVLVMQRILFSLCSDLETDVIGESVQRGFDADIKLIERRQLLLW
jgi:hypothetical protein